MTIGIYCITHRASGKRYVGKSINIEARLRQHKAALVKQPRPADCNRHLWNAVQKWGWDEFEQEILEAFGTVDEQLIADRELHWIEHFRCCERTHGYNLRRDSASRMFVHEETRARHSASITGVGNPNFGKRWSPEQRNAMSANAANRHLIGGNYGPAWRAKIGAASKKLWEDKPKRARMARKLAAIKQKYNYLQYSRAGEMIRRWQSVEEIISAHPTWKWQNIYSVCHGHKPTYQGYIWKQERKVAA